LGGKSQAARMPPVTVNLGQIFVFGGYVFLMYHLTGAIKAVFVKGYSLFLIPETIYTIIFIP
jgi:hypothetical protein